MSGRIKPAAVALSDIKQVEGSLAEMASIERKLGEIARGMNEEIDAAKKRAEQASVSLQARHKELAGAIKVFSVLNEASIFPKDKKSLDLAFGVIGFQASTTIVQMDNIKEETTLEKLHDFGFAEAINKKETLLKSAMVNWSDEKLQSVGLKRRKSNTFYIEVKSAQLPQ
jgi:phage host-nuclease inhibitor protein Gam